MKHLLFPHFNMWFDGDDDDQKKKQQGNNQNHPGPEAGDYNLGDDIGTKIGEGHDPVEDPLS
ncbi:MAG TPA: hypothetical protein VHA78_04125 [Candidatus Peribacteraceae bacterium]|nr:hypothetical protein [Candidatus Peribacteraceae bacterium]